MTRGFASLRLIDRETSGASLRGSGLDSIHVDTQL
jgi:hypothetical protein